MNIYLVSRIQIDDGTFHGSIDFLRFDENYGEALWVEKGKADRMSLVEASIACRTFRLDPEYEGLYFFMPELIGGPTATKGVSSRGL